MLDEEGQVSDFVDEKMDFILWEQEMQDDSKLAEEVTYDVH